MKGCFCVLKTRGSSRFAKNSFNCSLTLIDTPELINGPMMYKYEYSVIKT